MKSGADNAYDRRRLATGIGIQYDARNSAAAKLVTKALEWCEIRTRRGRKCRGALNLRIASFAGNSERQSFVRRNVRVCSLYNAIILEISHRSYNDPRCVLGSMRWQLHILKVWVSLATCGLYLPRHVSVSLVRHVS
ncbi:hypothetical protein EVAR_85020_1 [Eumeta japonica]|uniref:Uncharacterized protein n=1 Tax=Eumeta variegata TaxID=151549 RepID=A0A4C1W7T6_EUMVA|nr:hypothetical protein EVAR_85020_1 [Eumeta japonica]